MQLKSDVKSDVKRYEKSYVKSYVKSLQFLHDLPNENQKTMENLFI